MTADRLYSHDGEMELLLDAMEQRFVRNTGFDASTFRVDLVLAACDRLGLLTGLPPLADLLAKLQRLHGDFDCEPSWADAQAQIAASRERILRALRAAGGLVQ